MAIFYSLFFVRNVIGIKFPVFVFLLWVLFMSIQFSAEQIIAMSISFIPFISGFQNKYICMRL